MTTLLRTDQLLVSRQDPKSRQFTCVGILMFDGTRYTFEYDPVADRPLPGLPLGRVHQSETLFPIFAERVIDPHRPERPVTLELLGLPRDASPFEVLAVSGGGRTGDLYELTPLPLRGDVSIPFLVHGIRYLTTAERDAIDQLLPGTPLSLRLEPDNPATDRALLVTQDGSRLGYVPTPLLEYVHSIMTSPYELVVERVNPPTAGLHMRLLVRLTGTY
ncbi:HIRAN domain-containing protein [Occultella kanbiaonis]|uniref:HIRAN domain-containing protein n=1 Tax=Occultella kanbiaonis TaxID=2675754 RepID=UPI0013D5D208|nr:HIRAN domain-containing protein [Occultella kanbiaonis]